MFNNFEMESQKSLPEKREKENLIVLMGEVSRAPEFSHEAFGEKFYSLEISAARLSGVKDVLPVIISERVYDVEKIKLGQLINIRGQVRTYNQHIDEFNENNLKKQKLIISVYITDIEEIPEEDGYKIVNLYGK